jgi:hypothetical protein
MGRRLLFVLGLVAAAFGGWLVHHEEALNSFCNGEVSNPTHGFAIPSNCLNIVWPYAEGFALLIAGVIFVFAALMLTRRAMAGEHQYMKDLKAGKYDRENDHRNAYNFNLQVPAARINSRSRARLFNEQLDE